MKKLKTKSCQEYGTRSQGDCHQKKEWSYKRSVARSMIAIARWTRITMEAAQVLYEERKILNEMEGQDNIPTWKEYTREIGLPNFFASYLREYNALSDFIDSEKAKKNKRGTK